MELAARLRLAMDGSLILVVPGGSRRCGALDHASVAERREIRSRDGTTVRVGQGLGGSDGGLGLLRGRVDIQTGKEPVDVCVRSRHNCVCVLCMK